MLTNPIPKESHGKLHQHAICCKTNGWNMGSLREVSSALQARRREHAGDRATNFGENVSFRCSRAPTTTYGGPPPSRREARATSSLYILLNATQRCHFVISLNHPFGWLFLVTRRRYRNPSYARCKLLVAFLETRLPINAICGVLLAKQSHQRKNHPKGWFFVGDP